MSGAGAGRNPFGHIDLRVASFAERLPFYEALPPALGFTRRYDGGEWRVFATELPPPARGADPGGNRFEIHHGPPL